MRMALYYSIPDHFPAFRVDVSELFGVSLKDFGLDTEWFMANNGPRLLMRAEVFYGQPCFLPLKFPGSNKLSKVITRLAYWFTDSLLMVRAACRRFDVLQTRDKYIVAFIALILAKLTGKRFVYWCSYPFPVHTLELAKGRAGLMRWLLFMQGKLAQFFLYRIVMRFADHSFVQSQQMQLDVAAFGVPKGRMTPVPMGVPLRLIDWVSAHPTAIVPGRVVYLGTMDSVRHLGTLIDAFSLVHQRDQAATLLMVGDGVKPQDRAALERQVISLGLSDVVRFTGFLPIDEAWSLTASAAVCVSPIYPSPVLNCGSPTKLYEYMALGRPVVCNDHPEQTAVIRDSGAGVCVAWGVQEFADAMVWMLEHPDEAEAMGAKGPAWVAEHRSYPRIAERVLRVYENLLQSGA